MGERLQSQNTYVCSFSDCSATFRKSWKLEAHLCKHTGLCDYEGCEKDFSKKKQLKAHKCEHGEPLAFHCTFNGCGKDFPSREKLKHHEKVHQGYPCSFDLCPTLSKTWTEYLKHRAQHREKLVCEKCNRLFNNTWFLRLHELRAHSGEKRYFLCPREGCNRKFTRRVKLESHVLGDHEGKKPFSCAYPGCGKSFALKESVWRHGVVHNPAKRELKKRKPKMDKPSQVAQEATQSAADDQETGKLAAKLHSTTLEENVS
ncbi:general transcription factor IIIA, b isoform X2 [Xiphophorus couchianus]|uniref:general transcription factor IIIA, b isoform X2 n=1 Tax=Xiphophorus couchianus TaxID=32473 RepID=UPI001016EB17|nr:transcription factor IIIA isoform X2 [Xiphophorus couchianus]